MKHTQGPWIATEGGPLEGNVVITTQARIDLDVVPIVDMDTDYEGAIGLEQEANAKLIAAAPEMLDALKEVKHWLEGWASAEAELDFVNRIIAKATA